MNTTISDRTSHDDFQDMTMNHETRGTVLPTGALPLILSLVALMSACGKSDQPDRTDPAFTEAASRAEEPAKPTLPPPDLPADRVARGRELLLKADCARCHNEKNAQKYYSPRLDNIGANVWEWKNQSIEDSIEWLVELLVSPANAAKAPWHGGAKFVSSSVKPRYSMTYSREKMEDMAYYMLSVQNGPGLPTEE